MSALWVCIRSNSAITVSRRRFAVCHGENLIENEIAKFPKKLESYQAGLAETQKQLETAKAELQQPFSQEDELKQKEKRMEELNIKLNLDTQDKPVLAEESEQEVDYQTRKCIDRERYERLTE